MVSGAGRYDVTAFRTLRASTTFLTVDIVSNRVVHFYVFAVWASIVQPCFDFEYLELNSRAISFVEIN